MHKSYSDKILIINSVALTGVVAGVMLLQYSGNILSYTWIFVLSASVIAASYYALPVPAAELQVENLCLNTLGSAARITMIGLWSIVIFKLAADAFSFRDDPKDSVFSVLRDIAVLSLAPLLTSKLRRKWTSIIAVFGLGVSLYGLVNLAAYRAGLAPMVSDQAAHGSMTGFMSERMLAPLSGGVNNFGCIMACGAGFCLVAGAELYRNKRLTECVICLLGLGICSVCLWFIEMRAALFVPMFIFGWQLFLPRRAKRLALLLVIAGSFLLPWVFTNQNAPRMLEVSVPEFVLKYLSRREGDVFTAGGRVSFWDYGIGLLNSGELGWFGVGLASRDAGAAGDESTSSIFGHAAMTFHNGPLDIVNVYGPVIGLLFGVFCLLVGYSMATRWPNDHDKRLIDACAGLCGVLFLLSYFEAFATTAFFWATLAILLRTRFLTTMREGPFENHDAFHVQYSARLSR